MKRVVRSTRVPIAELFRPMMRSPSQCPGTARSSASPGRSLIMTSGVTNFLPSSTGSSPRDSQGPTRSQAGDELTLECTPSLDVERLIDRLVRDPHGLIIGEIDLQPVGDLLGAPRLRPSAVLAASVPAADEANRRAVDLGPVRSGDQPASRSCT